MIGAGKLTSSARNLIGYHRRSLVVRGLHRFASFVESAYANEGASFEVNGERSLLGKLRPANFKTAFDVGANFGDWSSEAANLWPDCRLHAFEVAPLTFQTLSERFRTQDCCNRVTLNGFGLSDKAGVQPMYYFPDHPELTADMPRHDAYVSVPFNAQLTTGDTYCDRHNIDTLDFLKVDVEGAEHRVIQGFARRISAQKVQCLQFEYGAFSTQTKCLLVDMYSMLSNYYWIGKIFPGYVDFREYHWTMEDFRFSNYCCVSKLRPDLRAALAK